MNKDICTVATAVKAAQTIKGLDPLDSLELDMIVDAVAELPVGAFTGVAQPHRTRKGQKVVRSGRLLVSLTQDRSLVTVQHVKVLAATGK